MTNEYEIGKDIQKLQDAVSTINTNMQYLAEEIEAIKKLNEGD